MDQILIDMAEYKKLIETQVRVDVLKEMVAGEKDGIVYRSDIYRVLGIKFPENPYQE